MGEGEGTCYGVSLGDGCSGVEKEVSPHYFLPSFVFYSTHKIQTCHIWLVFSSGAGIVIQSKTDHGCFYVHTIRGNILIISRVGWILWRVSTKKVSNLRYIKVQFVSFILFSVKMTTNNHGFSK